MTLYINGILTPTTVENEKTIGDILKSFELECEKQDAAVIGIIIDDKKVDASSFDTISKEVLQESTKIEFEVITKTNILKTLKSFSTVFKKLAEEIKTVGVLLQTGKMEEANSKIENLATNTEDLCYYVKLSSLFGDYNSVLLIEELPFNKFFTSFAPILKDLEEAMKSGDSVTIGDLTEYEISPRLESIAKTLESFNPSTNITSDTNNITGNTGNLPSNASKDLEKKE